MVIQTALHADALGYIAADDLHVGLGAATAPLATVAGVGAFTGRAGVAAVTAPLGQTAGFVQVYPQVLQFTGENFGVSASGDMTVAFPPNCRRGDQALLFVFYATGDFFALSGWDLVQQGTTGDVRFKLYERIVAQPSDIYTLLSASGGREGGGYIMHTYSRAALRDDAAATGTGAPVTFSAIDVENDGYMSLFSCQDVQTFLNPGDVSSPFSRLSNVWGDSGSGAAGGWSAYGQLTTGADPAYVPASITPSGTTLDDWKSIAVSIEVGPWRHRETGACVAPLGQVAATGYMTRYGVAGVVAPLGQVAGAGTFARSGAEVNVCASSVNGVLVAASENTVLIGDHANGVTVTPGLSNRVC